MSYDKLSGDTSLTLFFPANEAEIPCGRKPNLTTQKVIPFENIQTSYSVECMSNSILWLGMSYYEDGEGDMEETQSYVQYLEKQGVIKFTSNIRNGYLLYINDLMGRNLFLLAFRCIRVNVKCVRLPLPLCLLNAQKQNYICLRMNRMSTVELSTYERKY